MEKGILMDLRTSHARVVKNERKTKEIVKGDAVVVHDENMKRNFWRLGVIEDVIQGRDRYIRGARVQVDCSSDEASEHTDPYLTAIGGFILN